MVRQSGSLHFETEDAELPCSSISRFPLLHDLVNCRTETNLWPPPEIPANALLIIRETVDLLPRCDDGACPSAERRTPAIDGHVTSR
jgi:hypothetical protein